MRLLVFKVICSKPMALEVDYLRSASLGSNRAGDPKEADPGDAQEGELKGSLDLPNAALANRE
jgi:hypothetical protein